MLAGNFEGPLEIEQFFIRTPYVHFLVLSGGTWQEGLVFIKTLLSFVGGSCFAISR